MMRGKELVLPKIVLTDPTLFGNDTAEDERDDIFFSYALEREEVGNFADPSRPFCVAHAYKGEGKSALLRLAQGKLPTSTEVIQVSRTAGELTPEVGTEDPVAWVRGWKASILNVLAVEIGAQIGVAWSDDAMSLVEESEKKGFRRRSLLSSILDRLSLPELSLGGAKLSVPERRVLGTVNPEQAINRWAKNKFQLWIFVDDLDKNFESSRSNKLKVVGFFDAARELVRSTPELRVRTVIRPNIWSLLRLEYESLSHVRQYLVDLKWSEDQARQLLFRRVQGYLMRTGQWDGIRTSLRGDQEEDEKRVIEMAFESPVRWKDTVRPVHVAMYTLAKHRPRWVIELAKVAAAQAVRQSRRVISQADILGQLSSFGARRIEDLVAEFKPQCPEIHELVTAFTREKEQLTTDELIKILTNKVLNHLSPSIAGISGKPSARDVAAFLFEIGLYYGRRDYPDGSYEHIAFSDKPSLLKSRTDIDAGLSWEIHPIYRQSLELRDSTGAQARFTDRRRRR